MAYSGFRKANDGQGTPQVLNSSADFLESRRGYPIACPAFPPAASVCNRKLAAGHPVVQWATGLRRQPIRDLTHDLHDFQRDTIAICAGRIFQQIPCGRADFRLSVIRAGKLPIDIIRHARASCAVGLESNQHPTPP